MTASQNIEAEAGVNYQERSRHTEPNPVYSYHALLRHRGLNLTADHLSQSGAVLGGSEAPLGLGSTSLGSQDPRWLSPSLTNVHEQPVPLSTCSLDKWVSKVFEPPMNRMHHWG